MTIQRFVVAAVLGVASACASAGPIISTFTGGDAGEGLDLSGSFTHALTMSSGANNVKIGDATFAYYQSAGAGMTTVAQNLNINWYSPNYGASAADAKLASVMHSLVWSNASANQSLSLTMTDLVIGQTYKYQLLFAEQGFNRGFDVYQDNIKIVDDFSPWKTVGGTYVTNKSAVIANEFVATSNTLTIGFGGVAATFSDNNPILSAFTMEHVSAVQDVPEPGSLALLMAGAGVLGALRSARRRS